MSQQYIRECFDDIKRYANVIESRLEDEGYTLEEALEENARVLSAAQKHRVAYILIDDTYSVDIQ